MQINELLVEQGMTKYRLSKMSGIPYATINDICSGKARIEKCSADTLYKICQTLHVSMEDVLEPVMKGGIEAMYRMSFETFKSNVCHRVKDNGDISFIIDTLETNEIRTLFDRKWYPEALYLLAMVDYLSRENDVPVCTNYNDIRSTKLHSPIFPASVIVASAAMKSDRMRHESMATAIPEFMRFNIVESEVRNVI